MRSGFLFNCVQEIFSRAYGWTSGNDPYPIRTLLAKELRSCEGGKILDIGCGSGSYALKGHDYTGIDSNYGYIKFCQKHRPGNFMHMTGQKMSFPDKSFDVVLLFSVGHHLDDEAFEAVLDEARRVLTDNGVLLFADVLRPVVKSAIAAKILQALDEGGSFRTEVEYRYFLEGRFQVRQRWELVDQFYQTIFLHCCKS